MANQQDNVSHWAVLLRMHVKMDVKRTMQRGSAGHWAKNIRVLSSLRQFTRLPRVTQNGLLTVAAFRPWRGSQCSAARDPALTKRHQHTNIQLNQAERE